MYGARVEGNLFTDTPDYNPAVNAAFGARTDNAPNTVHVSPRFGFTWNRSAANRQMIMQNGLGRFYQGTTGILRGGFGEFRNLISPTLLSNASVSTGLPGSVDRISCIGSSVPTPDWSLYSSDPGAIPTACTGAANSTFSDNAPAVQLFDHSYTAPR